MDISSPNSLSPSPLALDSDSHLKSPKSNKQELEESLKVPLTLIIDKVSRVATSVFLILAGICFTFFGHPYLGVASCALGIYCFSHRNDLLNRHIRSEKFKEQMIEEIGGKDQLEALPEVVWVRASMIPRYPDMEFFPRVYFEHMTQSKMRIVENGETIGLAEMQVINLSHGEFKILKLTGFKLFPEKYHLPKINQLQGWDQILIRDGSIEEDRAYFTI